MGSLWPLLIGGGLLWLVSRFLCSQFQAGESDTIEEPQIPPGDPFSRVPSPKVNARRGRTGAVPLAEPRPEEQGQSDEAASVASRIGDFDSTRVQPRVVDLQFRVS